SPEFSPQPLGPQRLILCLRDGDGLEGWGEGRSGTEDFEEVLPRLLGRAVSELRPQYVDLWATVSQYWQLPTPPSPYAQPMDNYVFWLRLPMQPLVEMELRDLVARRAGVPVYMLMGGKWRDVVPADYWMGRTTPEHAARCARRGKEMGFHGIK